MPNDPLIDKQCFEYLEVQTGVPRFVCKHIIYGMLVGESPIGTMVKHQLTFYDVQDIRLAFDSWLEVKSEEVKNDSN